MRDSHQKKNTSLFKGRGVISSPDALVRHVSSITVDCREPDIQALEVPRIARGFLPLGRSL
jgi:hypothetical protein